MGSSAVGVASAEVLRLGGVPATLVDETWLSIPGFVGAYSVSDHGRVRSEARVVSCRGPEVSTSYQRRVQARVLVPTLVFGGYQAVHLSVGGRQYHRTVHELVLLAFTGPRPQGMICLHADDVKTNNCLFNLRYGTQSENAYDAVRNGVHSQARRTHCSRGHEYTPENTCYFPSKPRTRICIECLHRPQRSRMVSGRSVNARSVA